MFEQSQLVYHEDHRESDVTNGAGDRIRTDDNHVGNVRLYH